MITTIRGREHADRDRDRRRQRLGGKRRGRQARPDRRAQQRCHRDGRDRREPAVPGRRRRQGLGERPSDTTGCPTDRGDGRHRRPVVHDDARPSGRVQRRRFLGRVRNLRDAGQLSRRTGHRRNAPRSRRRPLPPCGEQGRPLVHVHDPARHALLAAFEPAGHRADLQAHDRARPNPRLHDAARPDVPRGCRRRSCVLRRQGPPHRRGRGARRPADDPPDPPGTRPAGPARRLAVLRGPHRHAEPARFRPRSLPQARTTSPRRRRDEASSCSAIPTTTATARAGCSGSRSSSARHTRSPRSKRRSSTTRSAASPPGKARDSTAFTARTAPLPGAGGNATSRTARSQSTTST